MGLLVDLAKEHNFTMSAVTDAYVRIETLQVFPRYGFIKFTVVGYVNEESGKVMKEQQIAEVLALQDMFYTTELLSGVDLQQLSRDEFIPPPQTISEPVPIFREYYSIYMKDAEGNIKPELTGIEMTDMEHIFQSVYAILKAEETRFVNSRDVIEVQG
jgi:hypothetical protein